MGRAAPAPTATSWPPGSRPSSIRCDSRGRTRRRPARSATRSRRPRRPVLPMAAPAVTRSAIAPAASCARNAIWCRTGCPRRSTIRSRAALTATSHRTPTEGRARAATPPRRGPHTSRTPSPSVACTPASPASAATPTVSMRPDAPASAATATATAAGSTTVPGVTARAPGVRRPSIIRRKDRTSRPARSRWAAAPVIPAGSARTGVRAMGAAPRTTTERRRAPRSIQSRRRRLRRAPRRSEGGTR